ncbi:hypothetical protein ACHHZC_21845 [Citrobacter freundii complex sp. 2024EL-00228]|uniref:hypothetical protein n=1 Tax=unclassified Citrobacter freundii complex TaxID=2816438 RepID=UPI00361C236E
MTTFTGEQLIEHAKKHIAHDAWLKDKFPGTHKTPATVELARIALAAMQQEPLMWVNEDSLPANYPYDELFPFSKVNIVRMFPVYAPSALVIPNERQSLNNGIVGFDEGWNACRAAMLEGKAQNAE